MMCTSYIEFLKPEHKYWFVQRTPYLMFITRYLSFRLPPVITPSLEPTEFRPNKSTEACSRAERGIHSVAVQIIINSLLIAWPTTLHNVYSLSIDGA